MTNRVRRAIAQALCELAYWIYRSEQPWAFVHGGIFINVTPLSEAFELSQLSEYLETDP
jgi:hypothetical protein